MNGVASARAIATLYGQLARGRLVRAETVARASQPASEGEDPLTGRLLRYGPVGYELARTPSELGPAELRSQDADRRAAAVLAALHGVVAA